MFAGFDVSFWHILLFAGWRYGRWLPSCRKYFALYGKKYCSLWTCWKWTSGKGCYVLALNDFALNFEKMANNLALAISMAGVCEAMNLGAKQGMDPRILAKVMNTSTARFGVILYKI